MEPFRLDGQAKVFLAVLIVVALALVPLAPFAALAFAALSLVVLCVVFLIALARNRRVLGPLTKAEGALALSAGVFAIAGALVIAYATIMLGTDNARFLSHVMLPFRSMDSVPGDSSVWYSDAETQNRLKEELAKAGVPFKLKTREGKEYVTWAHRYDETAQAINKKLRDAPITSPATGLPPGRAMSFADPERQGEFAAWLERKGFKTRTVEAHGKQYLVWDGGPADPIHLMNEFMGERAKPCKDGKSKIAQALGTAKCS